MPRLKSVHLGPRDYKMLRDIYEFYYLEFHTARKYHFKDYEKEETARASYNRRMRLLAEEELVAPASFFSVRRKADRGGAEYAYTLTKKGVQLLSDYMETELEWDTSRKDRKSIYIQHHVNVLYFCYLYSEWIMSGEILDYYGEQSARYQRLSPDGILKDFVKPDSVILFSKDKEVVPWIIEYERNSRASKSTILSKLQNYAKFFTAGYYQEHHVFSEHDTNSPAVFVLYCENINVANRRMEIMNQAQLTFYDRNQHAGAAEILVGMQEEVESNPYGNVYLRLNGERVSVSQINKVQALLKKLAGNKMHYLPNYNSTQFGVYIDGILLADEANMFIRFFPETASSAQMEGELDKLSELVASGKWAKHSAFRNGKPAQYVFVAETAEQEERLFRKLLQLKTERNFAAIVNRYETCIADPSRGWLSNASGQREHAIHR